MLPLIATEESNPQVCSISDGVRVRWDDLPPLGRGSGRAVFQEFGDHASGRRLKAGGSQDWLPHRADCRLSLMENAYA
jgi:hypothetical protein